MKHLRRFSFRFYLLVAIGLLNLLCIAQGQGTIFQYRNSLVPANTIDLHGLQVEYAIERFRAFLDKCKKNHVTPFIVITGAGNHSADKAQIKPKV